MKSLKCDVCFRVEQNVDLAQVYPIKDLKVIKFKPCGTSVALTTQLFEGTGFLKSINRSGTNAQCLFPRC